MMVRLPCCAHGTGTFTGTGSTRLRIDCSSSISIITPAIAARIFFSRCIDTSYTGMLPCFLGGSDSLLVVRTSRASISRTRVSEGRITASMYPRSAAFVRIVERLFVLGDQLLAKLRGILGRLQALAVAGHDVHRALRAHHRDFGGGPRENHVAAQVLRAHRDVGATVVLAGDHGKLGNRRFRVAPQEFGAVPDDAVPFLLAAREVARDIHEGDDRQIEGVAEPDEAGNLVGGVDIEASGENQRLVADDAHRATVHATETDDSVLRVELVRLEEFAVIDNRTNDVLHIVGLTRAVGYHRVELGTETSGIVGRLVARRVFHIVVG